MKTALIKDKNPYRISSKTYRANEGLEDPELWEDSLHYWSFEGVCPALCSEGCEVEPDGHCQHACPSILVALGLI